MLNLGKKVQVLSGTQELLDYYSCISSKMGQKQQRYQKSNKKAYCYQHRYGAYRQKKDCLTMRVYQKMSVEDIAAELGIRPTTVYKHIKKAKEALKKCRKYL